MNPAQHVYPTSLDLPDLAHEQSEPGRLTSDMTEAGCALCQRGICTQRVFVESDTEIVVHGVIRGGLSLELRAHRR